MQIDMVALLLDKLTHHKSIAAVTYCITRDILNCYCNQIYNIQEKDNFLMAKLLNLAHMVFNTFCDKLLRLRNSLNPIYKAKEELKYFSHQALHRRTEDLELKYIPQLPLSDRLCLLSSYSGSKESSERRKMPADTDSPRWQAINPEPVEAWSIPSGNIFGKCFNAR